MTTRTNSSEKLESAVEETLAGRCSFHLHAETWEAFTVALDAPTQGLSRLKRLLSEPSIFSGPDPR